MSKPIHVELTDAELRQLVLAMNEWNIKQEDRLAECKERGYKADAVKLQENKVAIIHSVRSKLLTAHVNATYYS